MSETIRTDSVIRLAIDSVTEKVEIRTEPVTVPMSSVTLTIATDSLRSLPQGASYSEHSGQASVKVSRRAATANEPEYIYVYASCDSLQLLCERYERTLRTLRSEQAEEVDRLKAKLDAASVRHEEVKEKPPNGILTALEWLLAGIVAGVIGTIITIYKRKER